MPLVVETPESLKDLVGREIAMTEWFAVTQDHIQRFAEVIEDRQWIHVDPERAQRESPYRSTIGADSNSVAVEPLHERGN